MEVSGCLGGLLWCWCGVKWWSKSVGFCPAVWTEDDANGREAQSGSSVCEDLPHAAWGCLGGLSKCWGSQGSQTAKSWHCLRKWKQRQCRKEELASHTWRSSSGTQNKLVIIHFLSLLQLHEIYFCLKILTYKTQKVHAGPIEGTRNICELFPKSSFKITVHLSAYLHPVLLL